MSDKYSTGVRFNHHMAFLETLSFIGEGVGAGFYLASIVTGSALLEVLGVLLVFGAVVSLLIHLGKPLRSWRSVSRLATSGVSRGSLMISIFLGLSISLLLARYLGLPLSLQKPLAAGAALFAVPVMLYAGLLLRSMKAIRLWRSYFVTLSFSAHSLASAAIVAALVCADSGAAPSLQAVALVCLLAAAAFSALHLLSLERSAGVTASLERLLAGKLRPRFIVGAWGFGLILPLLAIGLLPQASAAGVSATLLLTVAVLSRFYGDFAYRNSIVLAGAYEPIMPAMPQRLLGASFS